MVKGPRDIRAGVAGAALRVAAGAPCGAGFFASALGGATLVATLAGPAGWWLARTIIMIATIKTLAAIPPIIAMRTSGSLNQRRGGSLGGRGNPGGRLETISPSSIPSIGSTVFGSQPRFDSAREPI